MWCLLVFCYFCVLCVGVVLGLLLLWFVGVLLWIGCVVFVGVDFVDVGWCLVGVV